MNRAIFDAITESLFTIDTHGVVVAANTTCAERFGQSIQTFIGSNIRHLALQHVPEHIQKQRWSKVVKVIATKEPIRFLAERHGHTYNTCFYPVINSEGIVSHIVIYAQDITEGKKTQEILAEFQAKMVNAERLASVGTLSAMAAHELSQPFTVVQLPAQNALALLQDNNDSQRAIKELKECVKGLHETNLIIKRFRHFAHSKPKRVASNLSLSTLTGNIIELLQDACRKQHLTVDPKPLLSLPDICYHQRELEQLIYNIH